MADMVKSAMTLLMIFVAFSLIVGGRRGGRWAINLIVTPIRDFAAARIRMVVFALVGIIVLYQLGINILGH